MKKLFVLLAVVTMTMSSFTTPNVASVAPEAEEVFNCFDDCDFLATLYGFIFEATEMQEYYFFAACYETNCN